MEGRGKGGWGGGVDNESNRWREKYKHKGKNRKPGFSTQRIQKISNSEGLTEVSTTGNRGDHRPLHCKTSSLAGVCVLLFRWVWQS